MQSIINFFLSRKKTLPLVTREKYVFSNHLMETFWLVWLQENHQWLCIIWMKDTYCLQTLGNYSPSNSKNTNYMQPPGTTHQPVGEYIFFLQTSSCITYTNIWQTTLEQYAHAMPLLDQKSFCNHRYWPPASLSQPNGDIHLLSCLWVKRPQ